jgi:HEAT repeat protein
MKGGPLVIAGLCLVLASPAYPQAPKAKQPKKDDLPEVALVIPEDARPEVKAIIKSNVFALRSRRASERLHAAHVLGELGEAGKPVRGFLCAAMLDPVPDIRVAAADALKNIDPKMQYLAVTLVTEKDGGRLAELLGRIQNLEDDGEPLAPLVAYGAFASAAADNENHLLAPELAALSHIARNDLPSCRLIASALANPEESVRATALRSLARMKHGKLAVRTIIALLKTDTPANRIAAIETLTALADESTEEVIAHAIAALRYHEDESIRRAVDAALNKLQSKTKEKP